ncbi:MULTISPECIES: polysaccharide deacetylase family protein [unclassified Leucobacter]|uniref:polysaccharide deacetylase family protein n=1 Tax=unclassified Leucobacter TaxID=2621730 RepID=UPI00069B5BF5|nr:polysaccharide deacetylase family protein [Leucobacter sp. Ag1]
MATTWQRRGLALALATALIAGTAACAREPDSAWKPPVVQGPGGVSLLAAVKSTGQKSADGQKAAGAGTSGKNAKTIGAAIADPAKIGIVSGRIRNDALPIQARYVFLPGVPKFNDRVSELLWTAIRATGKPYAPQAFPVGAGLGARGCVDGSTERTPAELLLDKATGPTGGSGTAITCSLLGAFGPYVGVRFRTVTGTAEAPKKGVKPADATAKITADRTTTLYANVKTGEVSDDATRWREVAPAELWRDTVSALRTRHGGLSNAPVAAPGKAQLALAAAALEGAETAEDGGLDVTFAPGIAAPELAGLGTDATKDQTPVHVPAKTAEGWAAPSEQQRLAAAEQPFVGMPAGSWTAPIDCNLVPCVAVTYDDGPAKHTGELLDTLRSKQALATFFMLGNAASGAPDTVRRAASEGHELASHTMNHPDLTTLRPEAAVAQVKDAAAIIGKLSGTPVTMYRPPYGAVNEKVLRAVGWPAILWSVDTNDWKEPGPDALVQRSVPVLEPGGIVLFHDTHTDSVKTAGRVIDGLRDRGFTLATVSQLFDGKVPVGRVSAR